MQKNKILVTGKNGQLSNAVFGWLQNKNKYEIETVSLRGNDWRNLSYEQFDCVVHVAGIVPRQGVAEQDFFKINAELTAQFAKKAKKDKVKHFIYISSMSVYGMGPELKAQKGCITSDTPCNPTSAYGKSKLMAEKALMELEDESFTVSIIRVPSIYGQGKLEYINQYKHLGGKFKKIPVAFQKKYKSFINAENLCELIFLLVESKQSGVVCPDDGQYSAYDICCKLYPNKKKSRLLGLLMEKIAFKSRIIKNYYGAIYYDKELTKVFDGKYRVCSLEQAIEALNVGKG